jgi:CRP-like cAMP-binding protein
MLFLERLALSLRFPRLFCLRWNVSRCPGKMKTQPTPVLSTLGSFSRMAPDRLRKIARELTIIELPARQANTLAGESATNAYLVLSGAVKIGHVEPYLASILAPGEIFGLCHLVPEDPGVLRYEAITDSIIGRIPAASFSDNWFNVSLNTFTVLVNFVLGTWWTGALARSNALGRFPLRSRLSRVLLDMAAKFGVEDSRGMLLDLPVTQKDLADVIGSSRPQVNIHLTRLSESGALIRKGRRLILVQSRLREEAAKADL